MSFIPYVVIGSTGVLLSNYPYSTEGNKNHHLYLAGIPKPQYPVPAIPLKVHWPISGYPECVYIDALNYGEDDPEMVWVWDDLNWDNGETVRMRCG